MGTGFAANGMSMKYSTAYLQGEMLLHLCCLHNMQSISLFSSFMTFSFDTLALGRRLRIWNKYLLGGCTFLVDVPSWWTYLYVSYNLFKSVVYVKCDRLFRWCLSPKHQLYSSFTGAVLNRYNLSSTGRAYNLLVTSSYHQQIRLNPHLLHYINIFNGTLIQEINVSVSMATL